MKTLFLACLALVSASAQAVSVTAKVVADDFYSVFVGDASGGSLSLVGGSGPSLWFNQGAPFSFNVSAGQYIYVAAWDSASFGPPHAWIGEFDIGGTKLLSNTNDWLSKFDGTIKDPSVSQVTTLIQDNSSWAPLTASMPNGSSPYGTRIGGSAASYVWIDSFGGTSASENGFALFRSKIETVPAVPEPETYAMLMAGLGLLGVVARRRKNKQA